MNRQEIYNGLWTLTKEKHDACIAEAQEVGREHPTERGVLQLRAGIYNVAVAAGLASGTNKAIELMGTRFRNLIKNFPELSAYYSGLTDEEKGVMEVALCPEVFMRVNFYRTYTIELEAAEKEGDPEKIFKAKIKKEVLFEILDMWRNFRVQNNLFAFAFDEYSIHVSNGKVIGDSLFYITANESIGKECKRLCDFTDELEKDNKLKDGSMIEYKCAKYRYAAVSSVHSALQMNNRQRKQADIDYSHYLLVPFDNIFTSRAEYFAIYDSAPENQKPDFSLYYGMLAFAEKEISELEDKLIEATDFEKIELEERIAGLNFAKVCLDEAWLKRKDVIM